jgi:hypothetical protein
MIAGRDCKVWWKRQRSLLGVDIHPMLGHLGLHLRDQEMVEGEERRVRSDDRRRTLWTVMQLTGKSRPH